MIREGLHVYIGTTGTGKTHKAIRDAAALAASRSIEGVPPHSSGLLVVDSRGANNLRDIPEHDAKRAIRIVYGQRGIARVVPKDRADFDSLIIEADKRGGAVILIDEISAWATSVPFINLCRVWRHRRTSLFLTTQKVGRDIEQGVLACDPVLYVFRCTSPATLEWLERWHRLPPERFKALGVGEFYTLSF